MFIASELKLGVGAKASVCATTHNIVLGWGGAEDDSP